MTNNNKAKQPTPVAPLPSMSTPAAAAAAPAADAASKPAASSSPAVENTKPAKEGLAEVNREVTSEITQDGMRIESNWSQVVSSFDDMNLKDELLRGIYAYGFEKPSAIQQRGSDSAQTHANCSAGASAGQSAEASAASCALVPVTATDCDSVTPSLVLRYVLESCPSSLATTPSPRLSPELERPPLSPSPCCSRST